MSILINFLVSLLVAVFKDTFGIDLRSYNRGVSDLSKNIKEDQQKRAEAADAVTKEVASLGDDELDDLLRPPPRRVHPLPVIR